MVYFIKVMEILTSELTKDGVQLTRSISWTFKCFCSSSELTNLSLHSKHGHRCSNSSTARNQIIFTVHITLTCTISYNRQLPKIKQV